MAAPAEQADEYTAFDWDKDKRQWYWSFKHLADVPVDKIPRIRPMSETGGTILILTSGQEQTKKTCNRTINMFKALGWHCVVIYGLNDDKKKEQQWEWPKGFGCRASFSWGFKLVPIMAQAVGQLPDGAPIAWAEDSCWPTKNCTPGNLYKLFEKHGPLWAGAYGRQKPKKFDYTMLESRELINKPCKGRAPPGAKLFVGTKETVYQVHNAFLHTGKDMTTDGIFHLLVCSNLLHVVDPFLAGTQDHWSSGKNTIHKSHKSSTKPLRLDGELLDVKLYDYEERPCRCQTC